MSAVDGLPSPRLREPLCAGDVMALIENTVSGSSLALSVNGNLWGPMKRAPSATVFGLTEPLVGE